jgi:dTDP-4-amino-4,6-dideoxygalactose transaminase
MSIPLIDLRTQFQTIKQELLEAAERVLKSGTYVAADEAAGLEKEIADWTGAKYAVSVANGTDALILALHACGVGPGDEVITSPYTFFATAEAIARVGAVPVFADIDPYTYNLSPERVEEKLSTRTKAIIPVHIFGQPADMASFMELADRHGLKVIEDACQALGAVYQGKPVGGIGHAGCISFFPTKNLGGFGDGGMLVTNDEETANHARLLSLHGSKQKYMHDIVGYNSRLDEIQAALLRVKLRRLEDWNLQRQQKASVYNRLLKDTELVLPYTSPMGNHVFHVYSIQSEQRDRLSEALKIAGVATGHYYPCPLHLQKAFADLGYKPGDLPVAEQLCTRALALPIYPELSEAQQEYICSVILTGL